MIRTFIAFAAGVSFLLFVGSGLLWWRSYRTVDDLFVIYKSGGASEQFRSIGGLFTWSHTAAAGGQWSGIEHVTLRQTRFESIAPRPFGEIFINQDWGLFQFVDQRYEKQRFSPQVIGALRARAVPPLPAGPKLPAVWQLVMRGWIAMVVFGLLPVVLGAGLVGRRLRRKSVSSRGPAPGQRFRRSVVRAMAAGAILVFAGIVALWVASYRHPMTLCIVTAQSDQWRVYSAGGQIGVDNQPAVFLNSKYSRYADLSQEIRAVESQLAGISPTVRDVKTVQLRSRLTLQINQMKALQSFFLPMIVGHGTSYLRPALAAGAIALFLLLWLVLRRPRAAGHCGNCNYNLTGNTSGVCPECGAALGSGASAATVWQARLEGRPL